MKKFLSFVLVLALALAVAIPVSAASVKEQEKDGAILYSEANDWSVYVPGAGTVTISVKSGNIVETYTFTFDGSGTYPIDAQEAFKGQLTLESFTPAEPIIVNIGFIGYYIYEGEILSTSIHWQNLVKEGDMIDWDAVDAAYDEWMAQGGLEPDRSEWLTSGYASFTFEDYAALGYGDFNIGQLENYYKAYFVDPGYVLPGDDDTTPPTPPVFNKGCENCEGNNPDKRCDGRGCDGNGTGPKGGGNQQ